MRSEGKNVSVLRQTFSKKNSWPCKGSIVSLRTRVAYHTSSMGGSKTVEIQVGEERCSWFVHDGLLDHHTNLLDANKRYNSAIRVPESRVFRLPQENAHTFSMLVEWMYTVKTDTIVKIKREFEALDLLTLADKLGARVLRNEMIAHLDYYFGTAQGPNEKQFVLTASFAKASYSLTSANSHKIRRFVMDTKFCLMTRVDYNFDDWLAFAKQFPDFVVDYRAAADVFEEGYPYDPVNDMGRYYVKTEAEY